MSDWSDLIDAERLAGLEPSVGLGLLRHGLADRPLAESRRVFTNRTLRMETIKAVGFDLDWTLAHYDRNAMSQLAFELTLDRVEGLGLFVEVETIADESSKDVARFNVDPLYHPLPVTVHKPTPPVGIAMSNVRPGHPCRRTRFRITRIC